jgi:hypothetical protein
MTTARAVVLLAIVSLAGCAHRTTSSAGSVWRLRGAVTTVQPNLLVIRHKTGQLVQVVMDDQTVIIRGDRRESAAALRPGVRVAVTVETSAQRGYRARQIELFGRGAKQD